MAGYTTDAHNGMRRNHVQADNDNGGVRSAYSENEQVQGPTSMGGASMFRQSVGDDSYSASMSQSRNTFPKVSLGFTRGN